MITPLIALAQEFKSTFGKDIHVISDKALSDIKNKSMEAVGNVIITYKNDAIYGQKATINFKTGDILIEGNVRYISPILTIYGSKMEYNFKKSSLTVYKARIISDDYIILGEKLKRVKNNIIIGTDAEYTTCRDCPESWSIYGKHIHVTLGEYVKIKHGSIKVKGVVMMYFPYFIFPIKKKRETGLLFPSLKFDIQDGTIFSQPWFWAINPSMDSTITPTFWGKRGVGTTLQFRHIPSRSSWYEVNSLQIFDRIYQEGKQDDNVVTGYKNKRNIFSYEHHYTGRKHFNHHLLYSRLSDLDLMRDFNQYSMNRTANSEPGVSTFLNWRFSPRVDLNLEGYFINNQLYNNPKDFDDRYVQILPKISLSLMPYSLVLNKFPLNSIQLGFDGDLTNFKQNHVYENNYIRNSQRLNLMPYVNWNLGQWKYFNFNIRTHLDYQKYNLPKEQQKKFSKMAVINQSEISIELDKIYGKVNKKIVERQDYEYKQNRSYPYSETIGWLPPLEKGDNKIMIAKNSYKHSQVFKLKSYYISSQSYSGNENFYNQITDVDGYFDPIDIPRNMENYIANPSLNTKVIYDNSIEIQWNNSLIKKSVRYDSISPKKSIIENYSYKKVSYFNLAQIYSFASGITNNINNNSRWYLFKSEGGIDIYRFALNFSHYYFYDSKKNIFNIDLTKSFARGSVSVGSSYNPFPATLSKLLTSRVDIYINSMWSASVGYNYDYENNTTDSEYYAIAYKPTNNCWKLDVSYLKTRLETKYSFNFLVNFNKNRFRSIKGL